MLMLWDSSDTHTPRDPPGLIFEPGPDYVYSSVDQSTSNHETNHALPFRGSPSTGIAGFVVYVDNPIAKMTIRRVLIVPVRTLVSFSRRIGTVPWQDWLHFATPTPNSLYTHVLHSQVLSVFGAGESPGSTSILRVLDFSLRSRRRQVQDDPTAPLPPFTILEFPFDADYHNSAFDFTDGGVLVTTVRIYVILRRNKILTGCTSRMRGMGDGNVTSGHRRESNAIAICTSSLRLCSQTIDFSSLPPPPNCHR